VTCEISTRGIEPAMEWTQEERPMIRNPVQLSEFAMSECIYTCAWCHAVNDSMTAEWCSCLSSRTTLVCRSCGRCFCDASERWQTAFTLSPAGTVFIQRERKRKSLSAVAEEPAVIRRPLILVVDDDKVVHLIAGRVLRHFGGTILHAEDGAAGLSMALETRPDIVITDAFLPKLDGRELARLLKGRAETAACKLVVITALYKGRRYRDEAYKNFHVDEYLEKPVSAATLNAVVGKLLGISEEMAS
jgi:CheY-like chemotaxis protein